MRKKGDQNYQKKTDNNFEIENQKGNKTRQKRRTTKATQ